MNLNNLFEFSRHFKLVFIVVGAAIILVSTLFTHNLAKELAGEEQRKIELWAEATRQFVLADASTNIDFMISIIEDNTTIPVVIVDEQFRLLHYRNIEEPQTDKDKFWRETIADFKKSHKPILVDLGELKQFILYDDSKLLTKLYYFPYIQLSVIFIFLLIAFFAFSSTKNAEQNRVWVGLSKETAHQLGTPISSLLAWVDLLKLRYSDELLIAEMSKDVNRLRIIAERFSKIGSAPDLQVVSLNETLDNAVQYLSKRSSQKVLIETHFKDEHPVFASLNVALFEWVIENLCKNAIDAMDGQGRIDIEIKGSAKWVAIEVRDSGKGIEKHNFKQIFTPGFTTKKRGWGLGLSLAKRIVESYHRGKIFVKASELGKGTTFRIELPVK